MDLTDLIVIITFISGIVGLIRALFGILADAPKAFENARRGWALVSARLSIFLKTATNVSIFATLGLRAYIKKSTLSKKLLQVISTYKEGEPSPSPVPMNTTITPLTGTLRLNVFDEVRVGGSASTSARLS